MATIKILGSSPPSEHNLEGSSVMIGLDGEDRAVVGLLPEDQVAAEVRRSGDSYRIVVRPGRAPVLVNNLEVRDEQLSHGDVIGLAGHSLLFESRPLAAAIVKDLPSAPSEDEILTIDQLNRREIKKPLPDPLSDLHLEELFSLEGERSKLRLARPDFATSRPSRMNLFLLYQVARSLNSVKSLGEVLDQTLSMICEGIGAERGVVFSLDGSAELEVLASVNVEALSLDSATIRNIAGRAVRDHSAIVCADACYDPNLDAGATVIASVLRSVLCVPLWDGDQVAGVIYLDNLAATHAFDEIDMDLISAVGSQVAVRIQQDKIQGRMRDIALFQANLERFHSPDVAKLVMSQALEGTKDWASFLKEREVTILFADISAFTPLIEKIDKQIAADLLNSYFDTMTSIIFKYKGTVDKFIGDAIMATFGAPISYGNDAELAIFAAIEMMQKMDEFKRALPLQQQFDIRIGINTGVVITGYLGSKTRIEYTVLGDPVNVAARVQHIAPPRTILVGESTYAQVGATFKFQDKGLTQLKGKSRMTRVYEIIY